MRKLIDLIDDIRSNSMLSNIDQDEGTNDCRNNKFNDKKLIIVLQIIQSLVLHSSLSKEAAVTSRLG